MARVNASVERFRALLDDMKREVHDLAVLELNKQAQELAQTIEAVAPVDKSNLKISVRVLQGRKDTVVRIMAGDRTTLRTAPSGSYQYPRAVEFGTVNMPARPFFFPTYRLKKKKMISAMKRRITASIKKRSAPA